MCKVFKTTLITATSDLRYPQILQTFHLNIHSQSQPQYRQKPLFIYLKSKNMEGTQSQQEPETETEQQQWQNPVQSREGRRVVVVIETNVLFLLSFWHFVQVSDQIMCKHCVQYCSTFYKLKWSCTSSGYKTGVNSLGNWTDPTMVCRPPPPDTSTILFLHFDSVYSRSIWTNWSQYDDDVVLFRRENEGNKHS